MTRTSALRLHLLRGSLTLQSECRLSPGLSIALSSGVVVRPFTMLRWRIGQDHFDGDSFTKVMMPALPIGHPAGCVHSNPSGLPYLIGVPLSEKTPSPSATQLSVLMTHDCHFLASILSLHDAVHSLATREGSVNQNTWKSIFGSSCTDLTVRKTSPLTTCWRLQVCFVCVCPCIVGATLLLFQECPAPCKLPGKKQH